MIVIKKSHDDIGDDGDIANIAIIASANFSMHGAYMRRKKFPPLI